VVRRLLIGATKPGAESARRVLRLLFAFDQRLHTLSVRELAAIADIPLPTAHRYVALLRDESLVVETEAGKYHLSPRIFALARAADAAMPMVGIADPVMRQLAADTGETVLLVEMVGDTAICAHWIESHQRLRLSYEPGQALPLTRGASARMLLAGLPADARRRFFRDETGERAHEILARIEEAARCGWATSQEEIDQGIWAAAAGVAERGRFIASLTVPCPIARTPPSRQTVVLDLVRAAAAELSSRLADLGQPASTRPGAPDDYR